MEDATVDAHVDIRPTWRGWIHAAMFPVAIVTGKTDGKSKGY